jgi:hypothetical protein
MEYICDLPQRAPDEENPDEENPDEENPGYPPCFATLEPVQGTLQKVWHHGQMSLWDELLGSKYEPVCHRPNIHLAQTDLQPLLDPRQRPWSLNREEASGGKAFAATYYSADGKISHDYARPVSSTYQGSPYSSQQDTRLDMSASSQNYHQLAAAPYTLSGPEQSQSQHPAYSAHGSIHPSLPGPVHGSVEPPANGGFGQEHCPF